MGVIPLEAIPVHCTAGKVVIRTLHSLKEIVNCIMLSAHMQYFHIR